MAHEETIFALASARGRAGVAIVRISGPKAWNAGRDLAGKLPVARVAALRTLRDPDGQALDQALVLVFEADSSFTGEPVVELHLHGGPAVVNAVLAALRVIPGLRMAEAGEFTRRALENGRMDLPQVEGLADLLAAETEAQRVQALQVMQGELSRKAERWRGWLLRAMALTEAYIDFSEEDIPLDLMPEIQKLIESTRLEIAREIEGGKAARQVRDGFEVAIVGKPNVGKSTLLNALAGRDAAITSEIEGTTRDVIEVRMEVGGFSVVFLDLAGIRQGGDSIEVMGVERAVMRAMNADLRLFLVQNMAELSSLGVAQKPGDIVLRAKGDLEPDMENAVSGLTGLGIDSLLCRISETLEGRVSGASTVIRERQSNALRRALVRLDEAELLVTSGDDIFELIAEENRGAVAELDSLIGKVDIEDVLGEIFSSFCIGK